MTDMSLAGWGSERTLPSPHAVLRAGGPTGLSVQPVSPPCPCDRPQVWPRPSAAKTGQLRLGWSCRVSPQGDPWGWPWSARPPAQCQAAGPGGTCTLRWREARAHSCLLALSQQEVARAPSELPSLPQATAWAALRVGKPRRRLHGPPALRLPSPPAQLRWPRSAGQGRGRRGAAAGMAGPPAPRVPAG